MTETLKVNMVLNIHRNQKGGQKGGKGGGGWRGRLYTYHYTVISCTEVGSDESHLNVSLIEGQDHRTVSTNHNLSEEKGEPNRNRTEVLLLIGLARPNRLTISITDT